MTNLRYFSLSVALLLCIGMAGCAHSDIPDDVISESVMVDFLEQAYLLEGFYAVETGFQYDTLHPQMVASYDSLFSTFNITREAFEHSVGWYCRHPDIYGRIHDTVLSRLDAAIAETR